MIRGVFVSLVPVILLLMLLIWLDRLRLARTGIILICLGLGCVGAILCLACNTAIISFFRLPFHVYSLFGAPVTEEAMKLSVLLVFFSLNRIGFMIDGAMYGFATGTGFAMAENAIYLFWPSIPDLTIQEMMVRGTGTAVMHAGTTALAGIIAAGGINRGVRLFVSLIPALFAAILMHVLYNFPDEPSAITALIAFILFPALIIMVFRLNEGAVRRWLDSGFTTEVSLLLMIRKGRFGQTRAGQYLQTLGSHFSPLGLVDLYCYLELSLELSTRARALILMREAGIVPPPDPALSEKRRELKALRRRIGLTGYLALAPLIRTGL